MPKFLGRFYFTQTRNGNLVGEYANSGMSDVGTESAVLIGLFDPAKPFIGDYHTSWLEDVEPHFAMLNISQDASGTAYILKWKGADGKQIFSGEATVAHFGIFGAYTNR